MSKYTDDIIESANDRWLIDQADPATSTLFASGDQRRAAEVFVELQRLRGQAIDLLNALTRYRVHHDQSRWPEDRPCDCDLCQQAEAAIARAKGQI